MEVGMDPVLATDDRDNSSTMNRPNSALSDLVPTPDNISVLKEKISNLSKHPEFASRHRDRLNACNLAFFAYDASLFNGPKEKDAFHPSFTAFRQAVHDPHDRALIELRIRRALFDHVCLCLHSTQRNANVASRLHCLTSSQGVRLLLQLFQGRQSLGPPHRRSSSGHMCTSLAR